MTANKYKLVLGVLLMSLGLYMTYKGVKASTEPMTVVISPKYSSDDIYYLSSVLNSECENCKGRKWRLVGSVVINRSRTWGKSIKDIVLSAGQFDTVHKFEPTRLSMRRALELLVDGVEDDQVMYFWNSSADGQDWNVGKEPVYYIDDLRISY